MKEEKIISYWHPNKERFDVLILFLAIVNSIMVPLEISFSEVEFFQGTIYIALDLLIDLVFLVDMILMFFTSFRNRFGEEVRDQVQIAINYLKQKRFLFDLCSVLGTNIFTIFIPLLKVFKFFKIVRIFRIKNFIQSLNLPKGVKSILKIIKITFYTLILMHVYACLWYWVVKDRGSGYGSEGKWVAWVMPTDFINFQDSKLFDPEMSSYHRYLTFLYYAILMLGCNEIGPNQPLGMFASGLLMLLAQITN